MLGGRRLEAEVSIPVRGKVMLGGRRLEAEVSIPVRGKVIESTCEK